MVYQVASMKTIIRSTTNLNELRTLTGNFSNGSVAAFQINQLGDAQLIAREIESFAGRDLSPITVVLIKST